MYDPSAPRSAKNRNNWFIGTPRAFPDGKHLIFDGSSPNPFDRLPNILGIASIDGGVIAAVEAKGAKSARTPDVHPDGKTVVFASCDKLRTGQLEGRGDQVLETKVLFELPREDNAKPTVCTMHRPRFSRDGKHITFEVVGRHVKSDLWDKYKIPQPLNEGDGLIEPWIMNADGTGARRILDDAGYEPVEGRLQSGGSKEPEVSPDGQLVAFSHGRMIVLVGVDGKQARIVATSNVAGDGNTAVQFAESDPSFSPDGKKIVTASGIIAQERKAPPGLSIIDLETADPLRRAEP
jgi:Tol biopolymer transport system component